MILMVDKVVVFLRVVDIRDHHDLRILLEDETTESVLTDEWGDMRSRMRME